VSLIVGSIYSHKKHIKTDYEAQLSNDPVLNDKIKKNQLNKRQKKQPESTRVKSLSIILGS
jgi:hypothetical protein